MFANIGSKIKKLAEILALLGMLLSIVGMMVLLIYEQIVAGLLVWPFGCLFSWLGSFVLYGFGELIESTKRVEY